MNALASENHHSITVEGATYEDMTTLIEYCRAMGLDFFVFVDREYDEPEEENMVVDEFTDESLDVCVVDIHTKYDRDANTFSVTTRCSCDFRMFTLVFREHASETSLRDQVVTTLQNLGLQDSLLIESVELEFDDIEALDGSRKTNVLARTDFRGGSFRFAVVDKKSLPSGDACWLDRLATVRPWPEHTKEELDEIRRKLSGNDLDHLATVEELDEIRRKLNGTFLYCRGVGRASSEVEW